MRRVLFSEGQPCLCIFVQMSRAVCRTDDVTAGIVVPTVVGFCVVVIFLILSVALVHVYKIRSRFL